jgi:hypothetical protein
MGGTLRQHVGKEPRWNFYNQFIEKFNQLQRLKLRISYKVLPYFAVALAAKQGRGSD